MARPTNPHSTPNQCSDLMDNPDCETLLRYFDELNENHNRVSTKAFRDHLLRWGVPQDAVKRYVTEMDPKKKGYIRRRDLCDTLNYYPNQSPYLKDVYIIETDMQQHQRESIIWIIIEEVRIGGLPRDYLARAKERIEKLYGKEWNIFQAFQGFWGICQYKMASNLWFKYRGRTYGVYQVPNHLKALKASKH